MFTVVMFAAEHF